MSGEHNISYDNRRILFCINGYHSYHKSSIYKIILYPLLYKGEDFFIMSKNQITKDEIKVQVEKLKTELYNERTYDGKDLAHKYLNRVLDKISEYRY
jgi:hypothetical protein